MALATAGGKGITFVGRKSRKRCEMVAGTDLYGPYSWASLPVFPRRAKAVMFAALAGGKMRIMVYEPKPAPPPIAVISA